MKALPAPALTASEAAEPESAAPSAGVLFTLFTGVLCSCALLPLPAADGRVAHLPDICPFYLLTGLPCPVCGLTRALICIGHGQWAQSLHWHPMGWLVYCLLVILWLRAAFTLLFGRPMWEVSRQTVNRLSWAAFGIVLLAGALRIIWLVAHHAHFG